MITEGQINQSLEAVLLPAARRSVAGPNRRREINISDGKADTNIESAQSAAL
jgi:hypothetical protein